MVRWVLDSSVILKWFRQEEILAEQALAVRDAYLQGQCEIIVPALLGYEVANALRYKKDLTTLEVETAIQDLFDLGMTWIAPTVLVMRHAASITRTYDVSVYDATFPALAETVGATFVTADERLLDHLDALPGLLCLGDMEI